ncbi:ABC-2 type transport system permease protein [Natronospira proteinivora]|uniref:ABC-2 type transport system permease protein n=1 Tax=Natronospira proteinivora TaxID=1807133 RepID=A0ABT1GAL6_9GAMM|nr:hypothetical protein [Natronospira proteinivora]MCP1728368.1 ABC-2 type transport system permease protein [Natronospira proteinivora]
MIRQLQTLIRRELWEHKALWIAPVVTAALLWVATFWALASMVASPEGVSAFNEHAVPELAGEGASQMAHGMVRAGIALLYLVTLVVLFFYVLDSLYGERKDRSILFWRSLPVSDTLTVISKVVVALLVAPLIVIAIALILELLDLVTTAPLMALGTDLGYWDFLQPGAVIMALLESLRDMWLLGLWYLPFFGWLFLVSAWARKAAFLWALLPPMGVALAEYLLFRSIHFLSLIGEQFALPFKNMAENQFGFRFDTDRGVSEIQTSTAELTGLSGLAEPAFWVGLALGIGMLAVAVAIRRYRGETT